MNRDFKRKVKCLLLIFFFPCIPLLLISCSGFSSSQVVKEELPLKIDKNENRKINNYENSNLPFSLVMYPGKVHLVTIPLTKFSNEKFLKESVKISCENIIIPFYIEDNFIKFYLAQSYFSENKVYSCFSSFEEDGKFGQEELVKVEVRPFQFQEEVLKVDRGKVSLSPKNLKRVIKEKGILEKIYKNSNPNKYFNEPFSLPLDTLITSEYGTKRTFNGERKGEHLGTDFRAGIGVPIFSANAGKVVFVGNLFFTGNTVIIDHGIGIFSVYAHLSKSLAKLGSDVKKGDKLGLSGKTGRVTGPHLHWGVKIHNHWIDGLSLVSAGI